MEHSSQPDELHFEWDPAKSASNFRKHKVGFILAARVFADPFTDKARWQTIGRVRDRQLLLVVYLVRGRAVDGIFSRWCGSSPRHEPQERK